MKIPENQKPTVWKCSEAKDYVIFIHFTGPASPLTTPTGPASRSVSFPRGGGGNCSNFHFFANLKSLISTGMNFYTQKTEARKWNPKENLIFRGGERGGQVGKDMAHVFWKARAEVRIRLRGIEYFQLFFSKF